VSVSERSALNSRQNGSNPDHSGVGLLLLVALPEMSGGFRKVRAKLPVCMVRRPTAREKLVDEEKSASMYPAFRWRVVLLALMRYAACLSLETPRPFEGLIGKQVSGTPF
jgi:hypothetical protein